MNFSELVKTAPLRTAEVDFKGLFKAELYITPNDEIVNAIAGAKTEKLNTTTNQYETEVDSGKLSDFLASRVAGFKGLTLRKALTLCGRSLTEDLLDKADDPLPYEKETVETLMTLVVGFQSWTLDQLKVLGVEEAKREAAAQGN